MYPSDLKFKNSIQEEKKKHQRKHDAENAQHFRIDFNHFIKLARI